MNIFKKEAYPQLAFYAGLWAVLVTVSVLQGKLETAGILVVALIASLAIVVLINVIGLFALKKIRQNSDEHRSL